MAVQITLRAAPIANLGQIVPIPTRAADAFIHHPVLFHGLSARGVLRAVARQKFDASTERRARIEAALERLADLRDTLIGKLDAMDADPDLEPCLGRTETLDQTAALTGSHDDREEAEDLEPSLGSTHSTDQRAWAFGACNEAEVEHDGREPEDGF